MIKTKTINKAKKKRVVIRPIKVECRYIDISFTHKTKGVIIEDNT